MIITCINGEGDAQRNKQPSPRKEVQLYSNLSTVNLLPCVLSYWGVLSAPVCLSKVQLVSWPLQAVKASSFHWNRWCAQGRKPLSYFYPTCIKTKSEVSLQPLSQWHYRDLRHCTSLMIYLPFLDCLEIALGVFREGEQQEWIQKSVPRSMTETSTGIRDSLTSFWKWPDLSTEKEPCSARGTWQAEDTSFQSCLPYPWTCVGRRRKIIKTFYRVIKCCCEMIKADCSCSMLLCNSSPDKQSLCALMAMSMVYMKYTINMPAFPKMSQVKEKHFNTDTVLLGHMKLFERCLCIFITTRP